MHSGVVPFIIEPNDTDVLNQTAWFTHPRQQFVRNQPRYFSIPFECSSQGTLNDPVRSAIPEIPHLMNSGHKEWEILVIGPKRVNAFKRRKDLDRLLNVNRTRSRLESYQPLQLNVRCPPHHNRHPSHTTHPATHV